jgi:hypothetical protein
MWCVVTGVYVTKRQENVIVSLHGVVLTVEESLDFLRTVDIEMTCSIVSETLPLRYREILVVRVWVWSEVFNGRGLQRLYSY